MFKNIDDIDTDVCEGEMIEILGGFLRSGGKIDTDANWQALAQEEINLRIRRVLGSFSDESLQILGAGKLNFQDLVSFVANSLRPDYECPKCGDSENLKVSVVAYAPLVQREGKRPKVDSSQCEADSGQDIDYGGEMYCGGCGYTGKSGEFETEG